MADRMNTDWPQPSPLVQMWANALDAQRTAPNQWQARCPSPGHADRKASFGFRQGEKRRVVSNCMGCDDWEGIKAGLTALGLDTSETDRLFRVKRSNRADAPIGQVPLVALADQELPSLLHDQLMSEDAKKVRTFLQKGRGLSNKTIKHFKLGLEGQRIVIPIRCNGVWVNVRKYMPNADAGQMKIISTKGHGAGAPLYPESVLADNELPVLFCEGEFDALLANQNADGHFVAVTGTGGANTPPKDLSGLQGRRVVIAYDVDDAGRSGAIKLAERLRLIGAEVAILDLTTLGLASSKNHGQDISDFFLAHGGTAKALSDAMATASFSRGRANAAWSDPTAGGKSARLILRRASAIKSRRQRFLWDKRMPLGTISLFAGSGGVGKSTFAIWLAVELQRGRLPGDLFGEPVSVLYVSVEDDWETVMKPRLAAAGADMDLIYGMSISSGVDESTGERYPLLPDDLPLVRQAIDQTNAKLIIFDPITSTITGDDHKRGDVREVLDPLAQLARESDTSIVGIMHFKKGAGDVSDKVSGSHAYRDAARALMLFAKDDETGQVVMTQDKGNYADFGDMSLAYRLQDTLVDLDDGDTANVARVVVIGETRVNVSQIVNRVPADDEIVQWLTDYMDNHGDRVPAADALAAGAEAGYTKSALQRARKRCRPPLESEKRPGVMSSSWEWFRVEPTQEPKGS